MKRIVVLAAVLLILAVSFAASTVQAAPLVIRDTTVYAIQRGTITPNDSVRVTNVVVTGVDINPTTYGFWVQELPGGIYSGILVYNSALYPTGVTRGNLMRVKGIYAEYSGVSEINAYYATDFEILGSTSVPAPVLLSCKDLGYVAADTSAEKWEGVLVKLDTVRVASITWPTEYAKSYLVVEAHSHGGSTNADTVYVRNDKMDPNTPNHPAVGDTLISITGVHHYEYNNYRLCPRDGDDIIPKNAPPPNLFFGYATSNTTINAIFDTRVEKASAENINNYSLGSEVPVIGASLDPVGEQIVTLTTGTQTPGTVEDLTAINVRSKLGTLMQSSQTVYFRGGLCPISYVQTPKSAMNDSSQYSGEEVTIGGIVTGDKGAFITQFYMEQTGGGPWSGIQIYGGIPTPVTEGDSIIVAGFASEYYNKTELTSVDYLRVVSSGNPIPGPDLVDPSQIGTGSATAESYEGVFVRCDPVFVIDTTGYEAFGEWDVADMQSHTVKVGHSADYNFYPHVGRWMNIRGPIDYVYANYRIEPRRDADIDTINVIGVDPGAQPKPQVFALEQNAPNPFNPVTNIFFSIPAKSEVELYVYDISGRMVKRLVDGAQMEPGRHKATWDGRNDAGRVVSSGVYFCKLVAADKVAQMKMVVLK